MAKKKVQKKVQRTQKKEPARADKKYLGVQTLVLFILFQLVSLLTVVVSGRGKAYLYMMIPLVIIPYGGWFFVRKMRADTPCGFHRPVSGNAGSWRCCGRRCAQLDQRRRHVHPAVGIQ